MYQLLDCILRRPTLELSGGEAVSVWRKGAKDTIPRTFGKLSLTPFP